MQLKRFIITSKSTGEWVGSVYADSFMPFPQSACGNFMIGDSIVAQCDITAHQASDSGGRMQIK